MGINEPYITPPREPEFEGKFPVIDRWMQRATELINQISDGIDVNIQDQHTEIIDLHVSQYLSDFTITVNMAIDDTSVTGDTILLPVVGQAVCLKEETAFFQAEILSVTPNGGDNYTLGLDTPADFAFTTAGGCSIRNQNMAVDGSVTPVIFNISPARLNADVEWDLVRVMFSFTGPSFGAPIDDPDDTFFGTQEALTKGIVLRKVNGVYKTIFNAKTNADVKSHVYDLTYTGANKNGEYGVNWRRTFGGQSKNGVVIRLLNNAVEADADQFQVIVQDDLTTHTSIQVVVQGHVVDP